MCHSFISTRRNNNKVCILYIENSGHCIYSTGSKCFWNCLSLVHLVFYLLQSNTRYSVDQLDRFTYHYTYIYICRLRSKTLWDTARNIILINSRRFEHKPFFRWKLLMDHKLSSPEEGHMSTYQWPALRTLRTFIYIYIYIYIK